MDKILDKFAMENRLDGQTDVVVEKGDSCSTQINLSEMNTRDDICTQMNVRTIMYKNKMQAYNSTIVGVMSTLYMGQRTKRRRNDEVMENRTR